MLFGLWFGIIHTLGALIGTIAGAYVAGHYFAGIAWLVHDKIGGSLPILKVVSFILIFTLVNRLIGFGFYLVEKLFNVISIIPFLKTINRLAGAVLGLVEGVLVLGLVLHVSGAVPLASWFMEKIIGPSEVAQFLIRIARILVPLLPEALRVLGFPSLP